MNQSLHDLYHYIGQDLHFRNANIMMLIVLMAGVIIGMLLTWLIQIVANKNPSNGKYSGSLDDLVDSVNGISGWKPKSQTKK